MELKHYTLGRYYQLLQKEGLLPAGSVCHADLNREVRLVSCDSKKVVPGTLFIVKGAAFREEYLRAAAQQGAFVYVAEKPFEGVELPCIEVTHVRRAMALFADLYYNSPSHKLNVVGITGTKGKTSTSFFLKHILDEYENSRNGGESGLIGSVQIFDGLRREEAHLTTPEPLELEEHLANAVSVDMKHLTMEVSSQALKYDRVVNVRLAAAVFLNIGEDHISPIEHPDFEDYFASKLRIFEHSDLAVVNLDSDHTGEILSAAGGCKRIYTFSLEREDARVYGFDLRKEGNDTLFRVKTLRYTSDFRIALPGRFNVQNALAAIAVCEALGIPEECIRAGLEKTRVPGRMEIYANGDNSIVAIVDFAHNGMALENLLSSVKREYPDRRIVALFGCTGNKGISRRQGMGEAAGRWADYAVLTEDDPAEEAVEEICRQIAVHLEPFGCPYEICADRESAIRRAVMDCKEPTVLVLAGKGAETRQKRGKGEEDYPGDGPLVRAFLQEYDLLHQITAAKD